MKSWRHTEYVALSCGLKNKQELTKQRGIMETVREGLWQPARGSASERLSQGTRCQQGTIKAQVSELAQKSLKCSL